MNLRKKFFLIMTIMVLLVVFVIGYVFAHSFYTFPGVRSAFVAPLEEMEAVLSPDGSFVYSSLQSKVDLRDGTVTQNELARQLLYPAWVFLDLSPNGRYLTAATGTDQDDHFYLLDLEGVAYQEGSHMCESWSADSTHCLEIFRSQLIEMPSNQVMEEWSRNEDFQKIRNVSGDYVFLWDMDRRIPIAEIYPCMDEKGKETNVYCLVSLSYDEISFSKYKDREHATVVPIFEVSPPKEVVSWIFDPTGRYALFAVWEHEGNYVSGDYDVSTVIDTALVLVDWRAKTSKEIFRISSIDPEHVAVSRGSSALEWSSDGSTILVWRYNIPPVILKVKYP